MKHVAALLYADQIERFDEIDFALRVDRPLSHGDRAVTTGAAPLSEERTREAAAPCGRRPPG